MNRRLLIIFLTILIFSLPPATSSEEVAKTVLDNGLVIITRESRANDIVAVKLFLRCGPLYEKDGNAGISHLMQTLLLKGTTTRSAADIARESESIGARILSEAGKEMGVVSMLVIKDNFAKGLELFFDIIKAPAFPEDELQQEKAQALDEIKKRGDIPLRRAFDLFEDKHYGNHPYHKPVLGYEETIKKLTRGDITDFYKTHYLPDNMIIVAVGNFNSGEFIREVEENLGSLISKDLKKAPALIQFSPLPAPVDRQLLEMRETDAAWLVLGFNAPSVSSEDSPAMEVLDSITGGSMNSRLFVELRDKKGLAYQIGSLFRQRTGPGIYFAYAGTRPQMFEVVREGILSEMEKLKQELPAEDELRRTKTYLKGTFIMAQETNSGQANLLGSYELSGLGYDFVERYPALIDKVTREDIRDVARRYLTNFTLAAVLPEEKKSERKEDEEVSP